MGLGARVFERFFSISENETRVDARGFSVSCARKAARIESIGRSFAFGYNASIREPSVALLCDGLNEVEESLRGFAFEGAGMGFALTDFLPPFRNRWAQFLEMGGAPHVYMIHIGYGWAMARLPVSIARAMRRLEEPLRWLAMDGYGFHQGYFHWRRYVREANVPAGLRGYAARAFDQGLGRSLWFVCGADPGRVAAAIGDLGARRAPDLWAGAGLAATYAGGATRSELDGLKSLAGPWLPHVAQGVAFGAEARRRAGNPTEETELACRAIWGAPIEDVARIARETFPDAASRSTGEELYELWRARIRQRFR